MDRAAFTRKAFARLLMIECMPTQMLGASEAFVAAGIFTRVILHSAAKAVKHFCTQLNGG